ncbi:MAG: hypothetical protein ACJASL_002727 [Paraglaciecola sp.]|jgi:hypothetical protein
MFERSKSINVGAMLLDILLGGRSWELRNTSLYFIASQHAKNVYQILLEHTRVALVRIRSQ